MNKQLLTQRLAGLPLYQFEFLHPGDLVFSERVRQICRDECPMYGTTWACPPAVGTVEECKAKCLSFPHALMMVSAAEVRDAADLEETLATRATHEALTHQVRAAMEECGAEGLYILSTEACALCSRCTYPGSPCRHPDRMYPCVESHGIVVTALAERFHLDFLMPNLVLWYSLLFYR